MTDNKRLAIEGPKTLALRATVINGSIVVESEEDRERKREERAKKRKSRWDGGGSSSSGGPVHKQKYSVVPQLPSMINIANTDQNAQEIYIC